LPYGSLQTHTATNSRLLKYTIFLASKIGFLSSAEICPHKSARIFHHQELKLYIQLLVLSNLAANCCYHGWDGTAFLSAARFDKYQKLYVQFELLMMGGGTG
jgi:hypothetical protein